MSTAAERLAAFAAAIELDEVPRDVAAAAKLHVLDVLGCGLAAHAVGEARYAAAAAVEAASHGPATAIGLEQGLPAHEAAFVNGTLCHALDYDDTHAASVVHVSASVVPAALAAAELHGCSGKDTLAAIVREVGDRRRRTAPAPFTRGVASKQRSG